MPLPTAKPSPDTWAMPREERVAMAVQGCRELTRINRDEEAFFRGERPSSGLGGVDFPKLIHDRYTEWMAQITAANAANMPFLANENRPRANDNAAPELPFNTPPKKRRRAPAPV